MDKNMDKSMKKIKPKRDLLRFKKGEIWVTEGVGIEINGEEPVEIISLDKLDEKDFKHVRDTKDLDFAKKKG